METNLLSQVDSKYEKVLRWLVASSAYNLISTIALFIFILGLLVTSNILFLASAIIYGGSLATFVFLYKKYKKKPPQLPSQLPPPPEAIAQTPSKGTTPEEWREEELEKSEEEFKEEDKEDENLLGDRPSLLG